MSTKKKPLEFQNENLDISAKILKNSEEIHDLDLEIEDSLGRQLRRRKEISREFKDQYDISKQIIANVNKDIAFQENRINKGEQWVAALEKKRKSTSSSIGNITKKLYSPKSVNLSQSEIKNLLEEKRLLQDKNDKIKGLIDKNKLDILSRRDGVKLAKSEIEDQKSIMGVLKKKYVQNEKINSAMSVFNGSIGKALEFSQRLANPWLIVALAIKAAIDRFIELDKAAEKFRVTTGYTIDQTKTLRSDVESVNRSYAQYGVNIDKAYNSAKALTDTFQGLGIATKSNVSFVALFKENLGIAVEDSAQVLQNFMGLGGSTSDVAKDTIRMGAALSQNLGVSFADVMRDVKKSSKEAALMIGGNPAKIMKAAIYAKVLGTTLESAAKTSRSLLNFDESINNELEASVLLGKNINFMNARRLAFEGDIVGSQKAALDVIKQSGDFNSMNVLQREALAKAAGMEVDDITKMISQEKVRADVIRELEKDQSSAGQLRLKAYKESLTIAKNTTDELFKQELASAKNIEKTRQMQGVMTDINNIVEEMKMMFSEILLPFIGPIISLLVPVLKVVGGIFRGLVTGFIVPINDSLKPIIDKFNSLSEGTTYWTDVLETIPKVFGIIGTVIGTSIGFSIRLISLFADQIGNISALIVALFTDWSMIPDALKAMQKTALDALMWPFNAMWNYLQKTFFGNSPSELGLLIVNGLESVGGMLLDALMSPFKFAWDFITTLFSGDGFSSIFSSLSESFMSPFKQVWDYVSSLFGESGQFITMIKSVGGFIVDLMLAPIKSTMSLVKGFTDAVGITKAEPVRTSSNETESSTSSQSSNASLEQRLDKLNNTMTELVSLMKSGAISVNLDGRKVSKELAAAIS